MTTFLLTIRSLSTTNGDVRNQTDRYVLQWWTGLKDHRAQAAIAARLDRLAYGLTGDVKPVGGGISELRIHYGPGYRVYFQRRGYTIIVVLCGGEKSTQAKVIAAAKRLLAAWRE
jgi:putative addiction module killer protein